MSQPGVTIVPAGGTTASQNFDYGVTADAGSIPVPVDRPISAGSPLKRSEGSLAFNVAAVQATASKEVLADSAAPALENTAPEPINAFQNTAPAPLLIRSVESTTVEAQSEGIELVAQTIDEASTVQSPKGLSTIISDDANLIKDLIANGGDGDNAIPPNALLVHEKESWSTLGGTTIPNTVPTTAVSSITYPIHIQSSNDSSIKKPGKGGAGKNNKNGKKSSTSNSIGSGSGSASHRSSNYPVSRESSGSGGGGSNGSETGGFQVYKDDLGAISFKLPGKITHKTTIKLAHYPQPGTEIINIEQPPPPPPATSFDFQEDDSQLPVCEEYGEEGYLIPPGGGQEQQSPEHPSGTYSNNCNFCTYNMGQGQGLQNCPPQHALMQHNMQHMQQHQLQQQQMQSYYSNAGGGAYNNSSMYNQPFYGNTYYPYQYNQIYGYGNTSGYGNGY